MKPGEKTEHNLKLSLEQLFTGTTKRLKVKSNASQYDKKCRFSFRTIIFRGNRVKFSLDTLPLFKINRKRRTPHGQYISEEKILTIDIKAGWKSGTKITFAKEGDEKPGYHAGDIIFVVQVKHHKYF